VIKKKNEGNDMLNPEWTAELKKGSIQLCIMATLLKGRKYGFQMIKEIRDLSKGYFDLKEGTLYPALHRLEQRGYLKSEWVTDEGGTPKKYYVLTDEGRKALAAAGAEWDRLTRAVRTVLEAGR
jgi:PadR family transcriptional regulator PadR